MIKCTILKNGDLKGLMAYKQRLMALGKSAIEIERIINLGFTAHRNPTAYEIKFGEGATHHKEFPLELWLKQDGYFKLWTVCPLDGLRYYRSRC